MKKLFFLGAVGYPLMEILYRGRTHYSMALAGGASAILANGVRKLPVNLPAKAALCGAGITGIEYACGLTWNRDFHVWDYRHAPLNLNGQVCLPYTLLWCALSGAAIAGMDAYERAKGPVSI